LLDPRDCDLYLLALCEDCKTISSIAERIWNHFSIQTYIIYDMTDE